MTVGSKSLVRQISFNQYLDPIESLLERQNSQWIWLAAPSLWLERLPDDPKIC